MAIKHKFQPTRPLRGATPARMPEDNRTAISTHAPLAGRDYTARYIMKKALGISTHAPLAGRDRYPRPFLQWRRDFNPRAPCGARPVKVLYGGKYDAFQPTRPLRGATMSSRPILATGKISTHAPLAGRDSKSVQITMHIFAITDKFQMLLHRMPPVRAFCSFLMQENHADFGCEPPK